MPNAWRRQRPRAVLAVLLFLALAGALPVAPAGAQPASECPAAVPVDELSPGIRASGLTVVTGNEPQRFRIEILGVLEDAVGPGRDIIVVEASGPIIRRAGGIWAGMSGSPVYLQDGRLVGAVAYGFSVGPSRIGGITPAQDMLDLLDGPDGAEEMSAQAVETVPLRGALRNRVADRLGRPRSAPSALELLEPAVILSTPGAERDGSRYLEGDIRRAPQAQRARPRQQAEQAVPPTPGDNFAAALSTGDVELFGLGTTTVVCREQALAFGHPFFWEGETSLSANTADAITIVTDPTFGSYKLGNLGAAFGTVVEDRLAGLRSELGQAPQGVPVTSEVTSLDSGGSRTGRTDVFRSDDVPGLFAEHLIANFDVIHDRIGDGSSTLDVRVTGTREDGSTWTYQRSNAYISEFDIAFDTPQEAFAVLSLIEANTLEDVALTGVDFDATVQDAVVAYTVGEVLVSVDGGPPEPASAEGIVVAPGSSVELQVTLQSSTGDVTATLHVEIPQDATGGTLNVQGMLDPLGDPCSRDLRFCEGGAGFGSLDEFLAALEALPANTELIAEYLDFFAEPAAPPSPPATDREVLDHVVSGAVTIPVTVEGA